MGKIDDMRRMREQSVADAEKRAAKRPAVEAKAAPKSMAAAAAAAAAAPAPAASETEAPETSPSPPVKAARATRSIGAKKDVASKSADAEQGKCPECGKTKALVNGLLVSHQKGFGKACPGSRKEPT